MADRLKFSELKEELLRRNLSTEGLKADMVTRLEEAMLMEEENKKHNNGNGNVAIDRTPSPKRARYYIDKNPQPSIEFGRNNREGGREDDRRRESRQDDDRRREGRDFGRRDFDGRRERDGERRGDDYSRRSNAGWRDDHRGGYNEPLRRRDDYRRDRDDDRRRDDFNRRRDGDDRRRDDFDRRRDGDDRRRDDFDRRRDDRDRHERRRSISPRISDDRKSSSISLPPGIIPLHERIRRVNNWDVPPAGFENMSAMEAKAGGLFQKGPSGVSFGTNIRPNSMGAQVEPTSGITTQMARQARRIYVGGIPFGIEDEKLRVFINQKMLENGYASFEGDCVSSVQINHEKNFSFVEFRTPEEATNAIKLNDSEFEGHQLKFRRPKDYTPLPGHLESAVTHYSRIMDVALSSSETRVFIGDIPTYLSEEHVKEIASSFGPVRDFLLILDVINECSRGYGFCEFDDIESARLAVAGLNNIQIGDRILLADFATPDLMGRLGINLLALTMPALISTDLIEAGAQAASDNPTKVMVLLNMIESKDLADDDEYNLIRQDVMETCAKFGKVECVVVPRAVQGQLVPGVGKIFVEFKDKEETKLAVEKLSGTLFGGRTVLTSFFLYEKYIAGDF